MKFNSDEELKAKLIEDIKATRGYDKDAQIGVAIELAKGIILDKLPQYKNIIEIKGCYSLLYEVTIWRLNIMGSEGLSSESYDGQSQVFRAGIPSYIRSLISSKKRVGVI